MATMTFPFHGSSDAGSNAKSDACVGKVTGGMVPKAGVPNDASTMGSLGAPTTDNSADKGNNQNQSRMSPKTDDLKNNRDVKKGDEKFGGSRSSSSVLTEIDNEELQAQILKQKIEVRDKLRQVEKTSGEIIIQALRVVQNEASMLQKRVKKLAPEIESLSKERQENTPPDAPTGDVSFVRKNDLDTIQLLWDRNFGKDIETMKDGMNYMVCAHNHNADLMRQIKEAMQEARSCLDQDEDMQPSIEKWTSIMPHVNKFLRDSPQKENELRSVKPKMASLAQRLERLESILNCHPVNRSAQLRPEVARKPNTGNLVPLPRIMPKK